MGKRTLEELIKLGQQAQSVEPRSNWRSQGLCLWSTQHYFTEPGEDTVWQQILCNTCPVQLECLRLGLPEQHGVWGGTTEAERELIREALGIALAETSLDDFLGLAPKETPPETYLTLGSDNDRRVANRMAQHLVAKDAVTRAVDDMVANDLTISEASRRAGRSESWLGGFKGNYPDIFCQILEAAQNKIDPGDDPRETGREAYLAKLRLASEQEASRAIDLMLQDGLTMAGASRKIGRNGGFLSNFKIKNPTQFAEILDEAKRRRAEFGES